MSMFPRTLLARSLNANKQMNLFPVRAWSRLTFESSSWFPIVLLRGVITTAESFILNPLRRVLLTRKQSLAEIRRVRRRRRALRTSDDDVHEETRGDRLTQINERTHDRGEIKSRVNFARDSWGICARARAPALRTSDLSLNQKDNLAVARADDH